MMPDQTLLLCIWESRRLALSVWLTAAQNLIDQAQQGVSYRHQRGRFLASRLGGDAPELVLHKAILLGYGRPCTFGQSTTQPGIAPPSFGCFCSCPRFGCFPDKLPPTN